MNQPARSNVTPLHNGEVVPFVAWNEFIQRLDWSQGEHLAMIGPTGQGKTTLAMHLLPLRRFVVCFATKPRDASMTKLRNRGFKLIREWKSWSPTMYPRRLLWPKAADLDSKKRQTDAFQHAFESIYVEGSWTVYLDELWYMTNELQFSKAIKTYLLQARALKISLMVAAQRPKWIPLEVFDQSTHLFFFRENDEENLKRIGGIGFLSSRLIRDTVSRLRQHECLYINSRTGEMYRTKAPGGA